MKVQSTESFLKLCINMVNLIWNTERDGSGTSYPASCSYTPTIGKNVILYAQWASYDTLAPLNYIIEGYDNLDRGGIYEDATANDYQGYHPIGNVVELTDIVPKRTAHKFLGWSTMPMEDFAYLDDDGAQAFLESDTHVNNAIIPSDGITVYAVWQQDYPTKIINGGFEVVDKSLFSKTPNSVGQFGNNFEVRKDGSVRETWQVNGSCDEPLVRKQLPVHITHKTFGWLQETGPGINITAYNDLSNMYSTVNQSGAVDGNIYQDILTIPGNIYKWRIRHTSRAAGYVNHLNILIGKQKDTLYPQDAYRTSQNVWKQSPLGFVGTDIATISNHTPNDLKNLDDAWETYEGTYLVPEGQYVTRFSYENVNMGEVFGGNYVDDIEFSVAYPLFFDLNGGSSTTIYVDPTSNGNEGYHMADDDVSLPSIKDVAAPERFVFLGWTTEKMVPLTATSTQEETNSVISTILSTYKMPARSATLYAAYAEAASVATDFNSGGEITSESISVPNGKLLPTWEADIVPLDGFKISKVIVDGSEFDIPELNEGESYHLLLPDLIGSHNVEIVFADMRIEMPATGQQGNLPYTVFSTVLIFVALYGFISRYTSIRKSE